MDQDVSLKVLKALEGRRLLGIEAFDDEDDGKRIDFYFDGKPQMFLRLRADCGEYHGVEVGVIREMAPCYSMGSKSDLEELTQMLTHAGPKCRACLACAGKTSSGVPFQEVLGRYQVVIDPNSDGLELRNRDGSVAAKVKP